jgi:hypothetical protein
MYDLNANKENLAKVHALLQDISKLYNDNEIYAKILNIFSPKLKDFFILSLEEFQEQAYCILF